MVDTFDPDAFLASVRPRESTGGFDPDAFLASVRPREPTKEFPPLSRAVTDIPHEAWKETVDTAKSAYDNLYGNRSRRGEPSQWQDFKDTGKGVLDLAALPFAPAVGAAKSLIGHPMAWATHKIGEYVAPDIAAKDDPAAMYEQAKSDVGTATSAVGARARVSRPAPAPTQAELSAATDTSYNTARGFGVELHPSSTTALADAIQAQLENTHGIYAHRAPSAFADLERLRNPPGNTVPFTYLESIRKALNRSAMGVGDERFAGRRAIEAIDRYTSGLTPADVAVNPQHAGSVAAEMTEARGNHAATMRDEDITKAVEEARNRAGRNNSGGNINNTYRQEIARIKKQPGWNPEETEAMTDIERRGGSSVGNMLRRVGRLSPTHGTGHAGVSAALGAGAALGVGAPAAAGAVALPLIGAAAKAGGDALTLRRITQLAENTRRRSPLANSTPPTMQSPVRPSYFGLPVSAVDSKTREDR